MVRLLAIAMPRPAHTRVAAMALALAMAPTLAIALQCPASPQQASRDAEVEVRVGVRLLGDAKGADLETRTRQMTADLLGRLPRADRVYLEQMLFASYCSALRDNATLSEGERETRIAAYGREMRNALKAPAAVPARPAEDPRDRARADLARLPVPYTSDAFFEAIKRGDRRVVGLFAAAGFDLNESIGGRDHALSLAIDRGHTEIVTLLLGAGVRPDGWSVARALLRDDQETARRLLARRPGAEQLGSAFATMVFAGRLRDARMLIAEGADLATYGPAAADSAARTGVDSAGMAETLSWLHEQGFELDKPDRDGWTPLMQAAWQGHTKIVRALLAAGADVNRRCACEGIQEGGMTPLLLWLNGRGSVEGLQGLLDAGADAKAVTATSRTALHLVIGFSDRPVEAATLLLDKGAPADAADAHGETPLMLAADRGSAQVKLLLARGARVDARDEKYGAMPLTWAAANGRTESMRLLLDAGAPIDARTKHGLTALAVAVRNDEADAVRLLLQSGARTDLADEDGMTPRDHALVLKDDAQKRILRLLPNP